MIAETNAKKYCREDISLIENYAEAVADTTQTWICHHRNAEPCTGLCRADLKKMKMYYNRPASELKFVTSKMHEDIHGSCKNAGKSNKGKHKVISDETKTKISNALKGKTFTEEHRAKIAESMMGKNKGKKLSAEHRAKLSAAKKGKKFTAEHCAKISAAKKGRKLSEETRAKISATEKITKSRDKLCQH